MDWDDDTLPSPDAAPEAPEELPHPVAFTAGARLGRYRIRRVLGMGGMGQVYAVWDDDLEQEVALKILRQPEPRAVDAFKREFRALADVRHDNFIRLRELFCEDSRWFFTMELVDGEDFYAHVSGHHDPDFARLREVSRQLAEALATLHEAGLLHRDVKPQNVLVERGGRVVLLDFGLVKDLGQEEVSDASKVLVGTVAYVAPELVRGEEPSSASDWYSFGVMLFLGLTGRLPFDGKPLEILDAKRERPAPAPGEVALHVPADLDRLCVELLDRDPRRRPSGSEVLRRLGAAATEAGRPRKRRSSMDLPFVGRPRHLETLRDAYQTVRRGQAVAVYVHGSSGVGKSALVSRFRRGLDGDESAVVLAGRCYERESVPYKGFDMVIGELSRYLRRLSEEEIARLAPGTAYLARLFPAVAWLARRAGSSASELDSAQEQRRRAFSALRELLDRLARKTSLVIALDDLQWIDADAAALLAEVMQPPNPPPLLLLLSYRVGADKEVPALRPLQAPGSPLALEGSELDVRDLPVQPLSDADAGELALALLELSGDRARSEAEAITRESGGNPYFVSELARFVNERSAHPPGPGERRAASAPPTFEDLILGRADALPRPARRLLELVALAGRPLEPRVAVRGARLERGDADALHHLLDLNLVRLRTQANDSWVEPYHDRVRETLVAALGEEERRGMHRSLAEALEETERPDPELLAVHFQRAREEERAAHYTALAAKRSADQLAFDRAARLYEMALQLTPAEDEGRREIALRYAEALANAGRSSVAARVYMVAAQDEPDSLALKQRAAYQLMRAGRADEGLEHYRDVLADVGVRIPKSPRRALLPLALLRAFIRLRGLRPKGPSRGGPTPAEIAGIEALNGVSSGLAFIDPIRSLYFHAHHLLRTLRAGDRYRTVRALASEAGASAIGGTRSAHRTQRLIDHVRSLAEGAENPPDLALAPPASTFIDITVGIGRFQEARWRDAIEPVARVVKSLRAETSAVSWELAIADIHLVWILFFLGRMDEFRREIEGARRDAHDRDDAYSDTALRFVEIFRYLLEDDTAGARRCAREAIDRSPSSSFQIHHFWALLTTTYTDLYAGEPERAFHHMRRGWSGFSRSLMGRIQLLNVLLRTVRAGATAAFARPSEQPRRLLRSVRRDARRLAREDTPLSAPAAAALYASAHAILGDRSEAQRLLEEAGERYQAGHMPLYAASCRLQLGALRGGKSGDAICAEAERDLRHVGAAAPLRLARALVPGF